MIMEVSVDDLFGPRQEYPDPDAAERLAQLVGLDEHQRALAKFLSISINPNTLFQWFERFHLGAKHTFATLLRRPPLAILAGDVGSGKTMLAEAIGDAVSRSEGFKVVLYPLSLATRGQGRVGEMTHLVSEAFGHVYAEARKRRRDSGKPGAGILLLIDEADALAQSREEAQMHHEDRAGVNAFIRGVDRLAEPRLPAAVIMCTNRLSALDPAIRRRAGEFLTFERPEAEQRHALLSRELSGLGLTNSTISALVEATGAQPPQTFGYTYSDLAERLIPGIVMRAFPDRAVNAEDAIAVASSMAPTPRFLDGSK